ncbi:hypothetical protein PCL_08562 [Purpureocillium lilacinum]|uniref:Uncharacterized protein n=1 Tax=Purpureocillium lilacinum TaxID=33203 RepID=A0A2U3DR88_PURLI|nr:hypothetical protein PCL_08562 [Purpureocillium lilacinum]
MGANDADVVCDATISRFGSGRARKGQEGAPQQLLVGLDRDGLVMMGGWASAVQAHRGTLQQTFVNLHIAPATAPAQGQGRSRLLLLLPDPGKPPSWENIYICCPPSTSRPVRPPVLFSSLSIPLRASPATTIPGRIIARSVPLIDAIDDPSICFSPGDLQPTPPLPPPPPPSRTFRPKRGSSHSSLLLL